MTMSELLQVVTGFVGSCGFAVLFHIRGKRFWAAVLGSLASWALFVLLEPCISSEVLRYFIVAAVMSCYAEVMARLIKTPTTTFITTTLVPLIPGASLYYTMSYAFSNDITHFTEKGGYTLKLASALALGILFSTAVTGLFVRIGKNKKQ